MKKFILAPLFASALFVSCGGGEKSNNASDSNNQQTAESNEAAVENNQPEAANSNEVVGISKATAEKYLSTLKQKCGIDLQLPESATILSITDSTSMWKAELKGPDAKKEALGIANNLFEQTKTISKEYGLFNAGRDFDEESNTHYFVRENDVNSFADTEAFVGDNGGYYNWFFMSPQEKTFGVGVRYNTEDGTYSVEVED